MSKLGHPVVYAAHEGHHATEPHPETGEPIEGSIHHPHLREFAGTVGRVNEDGTCDLHILVPNKPSMWVDAVVEGEGPGEFLLLVHEPEEIGGEDEKTAAGGRKGKKAKAA